MKILLFITLISMIILFTNQNLESECETMDDFNQKYSIELKKLEQDDFSEYFENQEHAGGAFGDVAKFDLGGYEFVAKRVELPDEDDENSNELREINILKDLRGKNHLLQYFSCIIDLRENEEYLYILTETLSKDLDDYDNFSKLPQSKKISLYIQILESIKQLHSLGYIHNDIKPPNVMSTNENFDFIKLIDFGLTKKIGEKSTGGSRFYLPFEKVLNSSNTAKPESDIVAVAVSIGIMEFGYNLLEDFIGSSLCDTKAETWKKFHFMIADGVGHRYSQKRPKKNIFMRFFKWISSLFVKDRKYEIENMKDLLLNMSDNNPKNILNLDDILDVMEELKEAHAAVDSKVLIDINGFIPVVDENDIHIQEVFTFLFPSPQKSEFEQISEIEAEKIAKEIII